MFYKDPEITVKETIEFAGSQSALARLLDIGKASVNEWVTTGRKYVPTLQAYRFVQIRKKRKAA